MGRPVKAADEKPTKRKILEAAIDLFAEQGYDRTSVRQIAEAAGITESAFYRHYESKDTILDTIFAYAEDQIFTPLPIERNEGAYAGQSIFRGLLLPLPGIILSEPVILKIARIMYSEMQRNERVRTYVTDVFEKKAEDALERVFADQIERGGIRGCDTRALSQIFNAFRSDWTLRHFILENTGIEDAEARRNGLEGPIRFFEKMLVPTGARMQEGEPS